MRSYARAGIAHYWIVNLVDLQLEIYTRPVGDHYEDRREVRLDATVALPAELGGSTIQVSEFFPLPA